MGSQPISGRPVVRNLTYALCVYVAAFLGLLIVGVGFLLGWIGDSPTAGVFALAIGLANLYGLLFLVRLRRRAALRELPAPGPAATTRSRPLTYALVMTLIGFIGGLIVADAGVGIIFGTAGFVTGWISALPITRRRRT